MLRNAPKGTPSRLSRWTTALVAAMAAMACLIAAGVGPLRSEADAKPSEKESAAGAKEDPLGDPLPAGVLARLGTIRLRHEGEVTFVSFVAGGHLLTAGRDNTICLWDLENRKEIRRFTRPTPVAVEQPKKQPKGEPKQVRIEAMLMGRSNRGGSLQVALTEDGKTLAAVGGNVIQLWELSTGKELRKIVMPDSGLSGLIFSPDGRTLAGRTAVGGFRLWSTDTGNEIHHLEPAPRPGQRGLVFALSGGGGGLDPAPGMAFTRDGKTLVVSARDYQKEEAVHSVKFIDVASGKETRKLAVPGGVQVSSVAITRDGKLLAYGTGNVVHVHAADTGKEIHKIAAADGIHMLVFSPDGKMLAVRGLNQRLRLWDTKMGKELLQLNDAERPRQSRGLVLFTNDGLTGPEMRAVAISPDNKRIVSAAGTTIRVWETTSGKEVPLVDSHWRAPSGLVLSADGKTVVSWGADRVVRRWQSATGKSLGAFPAPVGTTLAAFSLDGLTVALANEDNSIRLHDTTTGKERGRFAGPANGLFALAFAPGGKMLAARGNDDIIRLYDLESKKETRQIVIRPRNPQPQNTLIFFGGSSGGSSGTGPGLCFSPDGKLVVTPFGGDGGRSNVLVLFDAAGGKELRKIEAPQPITSFTFSPDGRTLATENGDETITLWEAASGKARGHLGQAVGKQPVAGGGRMSFVAVEGFSAAPGSAGGPPGVSFSPDGRAIAVRSADRSVLIWDVATGKAIGRLKGHRGGVQTILFAPDGKTLASGSNDTTVLLWDADGALKDLAKPQPAELTAAEVSSLWGDLAGTDATKANQGVRRLTAGAKQALPFLAKHLKPAVRVEVLKIEGWIADLESEKFSVRRDATANLMKVGAQAVPPLKKLLATRPPLETRKRAEELVDRLTSGTLTTEQLRVVRAVEALEQIGTPEARRLLKTLADGGPGELPTREAQAELDRLASSKP